MTKYVMDVTGSLIMPVRKAYIMERDIDVATTTYMIVAEDDSEKESETEVLISVCSEDIAKHLLRYLATYLVGMDACCVGPNFKLPVPTGDVDDERYGHDESEDFGYLDFTRLSFLEDCKTEEECYKALTAHYPA